MLNREGGRAAAERNKEVDFLIKAKDSHRIALMIKANVIGMGVGERTRKGEVVDELVVKVYVSRKLPKDLLTEKDLIPSTLEFDNRKVAVDVEESAIPDAQLFNLRSRPVIGGSSIGPQGTNIIGTGGVCVTLDEKATQTYILGCNHIMAGVNQLPIGTNIIQLKLYVYLPFLG